jgi:stage IV sporulation protein FB
MIAFVFGYLGLTTGNPLLLLIAIFVFLAALAERSDVVMHDLARGYLARDVAITSYEALSEDSSMALAEAALLRTTQAEFPVLSADAELLGVLTKAAIIKNANAASPARTVASVMETRVPVFKLADPLEDVLNELQNPENAMVAVTDRSGRFLGYITRENVGEWMLLNQDRRR